MGFRRPKTPQTTSLPAEDSPDLGTTQVGETSHDAAVKHDTVKSDGTYQEQSAARVSLLLISVFMSMFLVALDRTIISTVSTFHLTEPIVRRILPSGHRLRD